MTACQAASGPASPGTHADGDPRCASIVVALMGAPVYVIRARRYRRASQLTRR